MLSENLTYSYVLFEKCETTIYEPLIQTRIMGIRIDIMPNLIISESTENDGMVSEI